MVVGSANNSFSKEISIRKRIANIFNKREEDFPSLKDYNDYLEEVENMIFNLVEGVDVPAIEAKIAKYQEENAEQIINSRARKAEELAAALRAHQEPVGPAGATEGVLAQNTQQAAVAGSGQYAPALPTGTLFMQPRPTGPAAQPVPIGGHAAPGIPEDEATQRQRAERGARAGGWTPDLAKRRAFEEAFSSLWVN